MFRLLIGLFSLPLLAQSDWRLPPPPAEAVVPDAKAMRVFRTPHTVGPAWSLRFPNAKLMPDQPQPKPCAVPLLNVMRFRRADPPMPKYRPLPGVPRMREAPVPAPSCEDRERK